MGGGVKAGVARVALDGVTVEVAGLVAMGRPGLRVLLGGARELVGLRNRPSQALMDNRGPLARAVPGAWMCRVLDTRATPGDSAMSGCAPQAADLWLKVMHRFGNDALRRGAAADLCLQAMHRFGSDALRHGDGETLSTHPGDEDD